MIELPQLSLTKYILQQKNAEYNRNLDFKRKKMAVCGALPHISTSNSIVFDGSYYIMYKNHYQRMTVQSIRLRFI